MEREERVAGAGFIDIPKGPLSGFAICERSDDVCATSFVYCRDAQAVPRLDVDAALADIARREHEQPSPFEPMLAMMSQS
jgi:hypothetical protein